MTDVREIFSDWLNLREPFRNCIHESYMVYMILKVLDVSGTVTVYESQFHSDYSGGPYHWFVGYKENGKPEVYIDGYQNKITQDLQDLKVHPLSVNPCDFEDRIHQYVSKRLLSILNSQIEKRVLLHQIHDPKWLNSLY